MTTTTKTIREVQYLGPDGQPLDFIPSNGPPPVHPRLSTSGAPGGPQQQQPPTQAPTYDQFNGGPPVQGGGYDPRFTPQPGQQQPSYGDYETYGGVIAPGGGAGGSGSGSNYAEYPHRPPTPPSPSDRSNSPPPQHQQPGRKKGERYLYCWYSNTIAPD